ncbi:MAG: SBBP repeat-containing protein, partial [Spirulina sp.]
MLLSLQLLLNLFATPSEKKKKEEPESDRTLQSFVLEPILTPSALLDNPNDTDDDLDLDGDEVNGGATENFGREENEEAASPDPAPPPSPISSDDYEESAWIAGDTGVFTVGETGRVEIDYLFDGGKYKFELAIFNLEGMDEFEPGSEEFIREAALRALSNDSERGYTVISDRAEGARFEGNLGESQNWNSGDYKGVKTFEMEAGDRFAVMLIPDGRVKDVLENPAIGGSKAPLFSLATANPNDSLHFGQIADVTGDGNTFVMEDVRYDHAWYDRDYNDLIFQVRGATGEAPLMDEMIDPAEDWRSSDLGQELLGDIDPDYLERGLDGDGIGQEYDLQEFDFLREEVWDNSENYQHFLESFSQVDDERFNSTIDLLQNYLNQDDPNLETLKEQLIEQVPTLTEALSDPDNQELVEFLEANIISFTAGEGSPNDTIFTIINNTIDNYGGVGRVGNAIGEVVRLGEGYIQEFDFGGLGRGAILYGDGNDSAIFLSGDEWQTFQENGGVLTQGYPTEHALPIEEPGNDLIDLPGIDLSLEPDESEGNEIEPNNSDSVEPLSSSSPQQDWIRQIGTTARDRSRGVAVDNVGNTYIAHSTIAADGKPDPILSKYDAGGNLLWTRQYNSNTWDFENSITTDNQGNVYTVGYDYNSLNSSTVTKWDSNGNQIWTRTLKTGSNEWASDVSVDSDGNVYITGHTQSSIAGSNAGQTDAYIAKYNQNGHKIWTRQLGTSSQDEARSVVTDHLGNIYIAGVTKGSLDGQINAGGTDVFVTKYDRNGNKHWTKLLGSNKSEGNAGSAFTGTYERNVAIDVDNSGNIYLSGRTEGSVGGSNAGGSDVFVAKYNTYGSKLWTRQAGGSGHEYATGIKVDGSGNVYLSGVTTGNLDSQNNAGGQDSFIVKYTSNGNKQWTKLLGTTGNDVVRDIALD